jgi:hypothetical protein
MDVIGEFYVKSNDSDIEIKIQHDLIYMWKLKNVKLTGAESRMVIVRDVGVGKMGIFQSKGRKF